MSSYSIVLRTLGSGGDKYKELLHSIKTQTVQPLEFLVILPNGYSAPKEQLGIETFLLGEKGMVTQRINGIAASRGDFLLLVDDDISFPPDFVENLLELQKKTEADFISPIVDDNAAKKSTPNVLRKIVSFLSSGAYKRSDNSPYALAVSPLGGTIIKKNLNIDQIYLTQTGHGACIFAKRKSVTSLHYEEELWLEQECTYAYPDDLVFFYKAHSMGFRVVYAHLLSFCHLDAGATLGNRTLEKRSIIKHDASRNTTIFWYRYFYSRYKHKSLKRTAYLILIVWKILFLSLLNVLFYAWRPSCHIYLKSSFSGYLDALKFIRSNTLQAVPSSQIERTH